jgi:hypothetical protein
MKTIDLEEIAAADLDSAGGPTIDRMFQPEVGERAAMLEGDEEEVAARIVEILREAGAL